MQPDVLLIDTNPVVLRVASGVIGRKLGATVRTVDSGKEGLAEVARRLPDVILLSDHLKNVVLDEFCRAMLDGEDSSKVPLVLLCRSAAPILEAYSSLPNIKAVCSKPFDPDKLADLAAEIIKTHGGGQSGCKGGT